MSSEARDENKSKTVAWFACRMALEGKLIDAVYLAQFLANVVSKKA